MPLIDLHLAISGLDNVALEQMGIIANFFAGLLLAIEYFIAGERIERLNNYLDVRISKAYNRSLRFAKRFAKFNRRALFVIIAVVVLIAIFQTIISQDASLREYFMYYYSMAKPLLIHMRRILIVSLAVLAAMFVILFIAHSAPKRTLGAIGILLYIIGNMLLFLHTLVK